MHALAKPQVWIFMMTAGILSCLGFQAATWLLADSAFGQLLGLFLFSWGPALAAWLMRRWVDQKSLRGLGWNRKYYDFRWIALTIFGPLAVVAGTLGVIFLAGNMLSLPGFGRVELQEVSWRMIDSFVSPFQPVVFFLGGPFAGEFWAFVAFLLLLTIVLGATLGMLLHLGQEMGFRGYLLQHIQDLGFLGSSTVLGLLIGGWNSLLLWMLIPEWELAYLPFFLSLFGFHLTTAFVQSWLSLRTRSVYASATFAGVLQQTGGLLVLFLWNGDPHLASVDGLSGMLVFMLIAGLILWRDKAFVAAFPKIRY